MDFAEVYKFYFETDVGFGFASGCKNWIFVSIFVHACYF